MNPAVAVRQLSKTYRIFQGPRARLREVLIGGGRHHLVQALRNVSFEVAPSQAFGIVGNNGAGKSTLLKILTGTAVPTSGEVHVEGRLGALLELGAGFHPEFTGRENIYFSGAVMGFSPQEIRRREEEIVAFSELEEFIDEPVKTYSSGMYVRLGFAVATGFDFNVLLIDEALAVGDQRFQKKCTDRILEFRRQGKTILFCSHNLYQVRTLCDHAVWLDRGEIRALGPSRQVVDAYSDFLRLEPRSREDSPLETASERGEICWLLSATLRDDSGAVRHEFRPGETLCLEIVGHFTKNFAGTPALGISVVRSDGTLIYTTATSMDGFVPAEISPGDHRATLVLEECPLLAGRYAFHVYATDQNYLRAYDTLRNVEPFQITDNAPDLGLVRLRHRWR
jgi:lipopolysaccharide transport system ATP-binding protein